MGAIYLPLAKKGSETNFCLVAYSNRGETSVR